MPSVTIDDLSIHYLHRAATGTSRQRLLYVHGTGCRARVFATHFDALPDDCEAVAIDLPGHGASGGRGFRGMADHAACVAGLIRELGWQRCVVAGHSMGGGVALALALYDPELVSALMMIDSGARLRVAPAIIRAARDVAAGRAAPAADERRGFAAATPDAVVAAVRKARGECDPEVVLRDWIADDTCDFMPRLGDIRVPVLALCGREDELTPMKYQEYLRDQLPDCRLVVIEDAAHWPFAERPDEFNAAVTTFLASLPPS